MVAYRVQARESEKWPGSWAIVSTARGWWIIARNGREVCRTRDGLDAARAILSDLAFYD